MRKKPLNPTKQIVHLSYSELLRSCAHRTCHFDFLNFCESVSPRWWYQYLHRRKQKLLNNKEWASGPPQVLKCERKGWITLNYYANLAKVPRESYRPVVVAIVFLPHSIVLLIIAYCERGLFILRNVQHSEEKQIYRSRTLIQFNYNTLGNVSLSIKSQKAHPTKPKIHRHTINLLQQKRSRNRNMQPNEFFSTSTSAKPELESAKGRNRTSLVLRTLGTRLDSDFLTFLLFRFSLFALHLSLITFSIPSSKIAFECIFIEQAN